MSKLRLRSFINKSAYGDSEAILKESLDQLSSSVQDFQDDHSISDDRSYTVQAYKTIAKLQLAIDSRVPEHGFKVKSLLMALQGLFTYFSNRAGTGDIANVIKTNIDNAKNSEDRHTPFVSIFDLHNAANNTALKTKHMRIASSSPGFLPSKDIE